LVPIIFLAADFALLINANTRLARSDFPDFNDPTKLGEGHAMIDRLTNLVGIFKKKELDFSKNRAEHDDILADAYEYLMRHFAVESGKSKGQFLTPAEVSMILAKVIRISPKNSKTSTTAHDPTYGSGSLLMKVAAQAGKRTTLGGQEKDVTTAVVARMNMVLHEFPTASILTGNTLAAPKFDDGQQLRTYDFVVGNPPFSDKTWSKGRTLGDSGDPQRTQILATCISRLDMQKQTYQQDKTDSTVGQGRETEGAQAAAGEDPRPQTRHDARTPHRQQPTDRTRRSRR